jgi:hypothetical protein
MPQTNESDAKNDKLYVKKHKVNDILNDLYLSITKSKPDDPIQFAYNYFGTKCDEKRREDDENNKIEGTLPFNVTALQEKSDNPLLNANSLKSMLTGMKSNKENDNNLIKNLLINEKSPLSNFNIFVSTHQKQKKK